MRLKIFLVLLVLCASACTTLVPRKYLPPPITNKKDFGEKVKVVTIPLPVIATNPNEGVTSGALTAFLVHNRKGEVTTLLAPQLNFNSNFGTTGTLYGAIYESLNRNWEFNISKSTHVNEDYELKFRDKTLLEKRLEINAFVFDYTDGAARFYGFGPHSSISDETNFGDSEAGFSFTASYDLPFNLQILFGERLRTVSVTRGAVEQLPYTKDIYTNSQVPGLGGFTSHAQRLSVIYNTLDSLVIPSVGMFARVSAEISTTLLGSKANYIHYEAEVKGFLPHKAAHYITAFRLAYNQTLGSKVPFLDRSILGGENSLRGYGKYRFIDSSSVLLNIEERIWLFHWSLFNVTTDWGIAPFLDIGAVTPSIRKIALNDFKVCPGIGFRAVVRPNIVGRIDVGTGMDGPAVFVGLGYPF